MLEQKEIDNKVMLGFSNHLHQVIVGSHQLPVTVSMKEKNEENMIKESERLNMGLSLLWFFQLFSYSHVATKDWHLSWPQSTHNPIYHGMAQMQNQLFPTPLWSQLSARRSLYPWQQKVGNAISVQMQFNAPLPPHPTLSTSANSSAMQPDALAQSIASAGSCRKLLQLLLHLHTVLRHTASNPGFQSPLGVASQLLVLEFNDQMSKC